MVEHQLHNQAFIESLTELIHANLGDENFGAKELAEAAGLSQRKLSQNLRSIKKSSVSRFICETRLRKALELLLEADMTAAEVAYKVGFGSATYFNKCFHDFFGYPPGKIRKGENTAQELIRKRNISGLLSGRSYLKTGIYVFSGMMLISGLLLIGNSLIIKNSSANDYATKPKNREISIAILPFKNLSDSAANQYFIEGLTEDILTRLSGIQSLRVVSHASAEQFRGSTKSSHEIGKKLNVEYLVTGSGQKYNNSFLLRVQLLDCKNDEQLWSESYTKEIRDTRDIFETQGEIAQAIASKLKASITPGEKQYIGKSPTGNLSAYYYYLKGSEELKKSQYPHYKSEQLKRAEVFFRKALEIDSTFAQAYLYLACIYWQKMDRDLSISDYNIIINCLDSMSVLSELAISYNPDLSLSYCIRACYYAILKNDIVRALEENNKALSCNPYDWFANYQRGDLYANISLVKAIETVFKAACLGSDIELSRSLFEIGNFYGMAGFPEIGNYYIHEAFKIEGDSANYLHSLALSDIIQGDFKKSIERRKKQEEDLPNYTAVYNLGTCYLFLGQEREALQYYGKYVSVNNINGKPAKLLYRYIGYAYWQNGYRQEAVKYFKKAIDDNDSLIKYSLPPDHYGLAGVYAFLGDKNKAYENLKLFSQKECFSSLDMTCLKYDPLFKSIRDEPGFQMIISNAQSKYQAEHERVKKWLEENRELKIPPS
jgi:TolB-like protein/AraC-like DNA-binding protein/Tfp pilus assembly protein PilF